LTAGKNLKIQLWHFQKLPQIITRLPCKIAAEMTKPQQDPIPKDQSTPVKSIKLFIKQTPFQQ
jgi:hypothetical protein